MFPPVWCLEHFPTSPLKVGQFGRACAFRRKFLEGKNVHWKITNKKVVYEQGYLYLAGAWEGAKELGVSKIPP